MTFLVEANGLNKIYGRNHAVRDLDLSIAPGEIYGLVGSDGAGKTTSLRLLVGALRADSGGAVICGHPVEHQGEQARSCIGYLSQRFSLYEDLTVLENIRFFAELRGLKRAEWLPRCMETLEFVGLAPFKDRRSGLLSGGMRQKLGLASALVTHPQVLLLDEPTTGVDPITRQDFWQLINHLASVPGSDGENEAERRCVLLTTPYMDEASRCHRVGFMRSGNMIAEGTPAELRSRLADRILEICGEDLHALQRMIGVINGVEDVRHFGGKLHLRLAPSAMGDVMTQLDTVSHSPDTIHFEFHPIPATLEDVFIYLSTSAE